MGNIELSGHKVNENTIYKAMDQESSGETYMTKETLYPETLQAQVSLFVNRLENANKDMPDFARRDERNYPFLKNFFERLFTERNARSNIIDSPGYQEVVELANRQFPVRPYWNLCMDGRVLSVLINGASAGIGTSMRVPGAMHREFVRGRDGMIFLRSDSTFAEKVERGLEKSPNDTIAEIFDSHIHCAARAAEENQAGKRPHDYGLMADVRSKREMAQATKDFVKKKYKGAKKIITILTSFNPDNGFMYMGLETDRALQIAGDISRLAAIDQKIDPEKVKPEYTDTALRTLVNSGDIISTEKMVQDQQIQSMFDKYGDFTVDWENDYGETAKRFWESIKNMRGNLLPLIEKQVKELYPQAEDIEVEERAILLLTNAFSGYLHNKIPNLTNGKEGYNYDTHREQFVKIYEGGYPPFNISAFVINSHTKDLAANIELAASLVRNNRLEGRITDGSGEFQTPQEFAEATVPIVMQEIVRGVVADEEWQKFSKINWYDEDSPLPENWDTISDHDFLEYLLNKGVTNSSVLVGINDLRKRMAPLYDPNLPTASRIIEQYKVVLPTISGQNRKNYFVVPFAKLGFKD